MPATPVLGNRLRTLCQGIHPWRMDSVMAMVAALLRGRVLTVTGLGRALSGSVAPKHHIKQADRLVGNPHLHSERDGLYQAVIALTVGHQHRPVILVDWSDARKDRAFQTLRASVAVAGRALTLYEEVHPLARAAHRGVQIRFLHTLEAPASGEMLSDHRHRRRLQEPLV